MSREDDFSNDGLGLKSSIDLARSEANMYLKFAHESFAENARWDMNRSLAKAMGSMREMGVLKRLNRGEGFDE
ncbi:MAG: hypothetical protein ACREP9_14280 [Candidatus Dormibacteraceae bacterium]